jgi:pseudouridine 5'-phosphatase
VATSSSKAAVAVKRSHHEELFSYFQVIVCGDDDDVKRGKPAPDIFLTAARRLLGDDFDAAQCIVFEDSMLGVQAGRAAGMKVMALPDARYYPTTDEQEELFHAADERLPSLSAFDPTKYGL